MKESNKITLWVSRILVYLLVAMFAVLVFTTPAITDYYIEHFARIAAPELLRTPTIVFVYIALVPAFTASFALLTFLSNIAKDRLFVKKNVTCMRIIYLSCFAECAIFFAFGFYYILAFVLSFVALFIGVMLRIVMNLIDRAVEIKDENDYTI